MRLYVESNFALEFARRQEESNDVISLLELAETRQISLALPAFALSEPVSTLTRYRSERARFLDQLQAHVRDFERSAPSQGLASILSPLVPEIARIARDEMNGLEAVTARLLDIA